MKTKFYAVCNEIGCTPNAGDEDYKTQKAIFKCKDDAELLIQRNPSVGGLHIKEVYIAAWDE